MHRSFLLPLLALPLAIGGCAADDTAYPSLAPRPIERMDLSEPAPEPSAAPAPDPALDARIAAAQDGLAKAATAVEAALGRAERLARTARGAAAGSDRWLDAQTALAEVDSARAAYGDALTVLEDMAAERAQTLAPPYPPLEGALAAARSAGAEQTRRIDAIAGSLAS